MLEELVSRLEILFKEFFAVGEQIRDQSIALPLSQAVSKALCQFRPLIFAVLGFDSADYRFCGGLGDIMLPPAPERLGIYAQSLEQIKGPLQQHDL
ncbi:hypothetical protein EG832_08385 [bacterium]|nr:hypothetical protein [bacterium]